MNFIDKYNHGPGNTQSTRAIHDEGIHGQDDTVTMPHWGIDGFSLLTQRLQPRVNPR